MKFNILPKFIHADSNQSEMNFFQSFCEKRYREIKNLISFKN